MPQVASTGAAVAVADFDRDGWQDFYVTNSGEGSLNRLYRNKGDGTFADVAGGAGRGRREPRAARASRWARCGATTTTTASRTCCSTGTARPRAVPQRRRQALRRVSATRRAAAVGERQQRHLARLRPRRPARPVHRRLLARRRRSLAARDDADHAGELRVRQQRRPQVPAAQRGRRHVRGRHRRRWASPAGAGRWRWRRRICSAPATRISSSPTTTASRSCSPTRAASAFVDVAQTTGVGRTPKSGMNASLGDVFNDGRLAIYKTNISEPGVLVQGNDLWVPDKPGGGDRRVREPGVEPGRRPGRLELGRAVRRPEQRRHARTCTSSTATSRRASAAATGTTSP